MNNDIYNLSHALRVFTKFSDNLKSTAAYGYKHAVDMKEIDTASLVGKLEEAYLKERKDLLKAVLSGQKYLDILNRELSTQISIDEIKNGE